MRFERERTALQNTLDRAVLAAADLATAASNSAVPFAIWPSVFIFSAMALIPSIRAFTAGF